MRPYYEHSGVTIYHGDCREILPHLSEVDAVITDPPYGMKDRSDRSTRLGGGGLHSGALRRKHWDAIIGDDEPFDPSLWLAYPKVVLLGAVHFSSRLPDSRAWLVWDKREGTSSDDNADCDFAWTNLHGPARLYSQLWRGLCRRGDENGMALEHPHQKPLALMHWILKRCDLADGDVALDPYCGSGTTLLAAKQQGVHAIGIEIEERYCEIAAKRLAQEVFDFSEVTA